MKIARVTTVDIDGIGELDTLVSFTKSATVALLGVNGIADWDSLL
jgi:hypothetical protein